MTLPPMPPRVARLPRDPRGYPIPWNVLRGDDGRPFFIVNDSRRTVEAILRELCPVCGERLGRWRWFVGGPRSAFDPHGWYFDLPGHEECIGYALQVCPYLAIPNYLRHRDAIPARDAPHIPPEARLLLDETVIPERPQLFVAVAGPRIELSTEKMGAPYLRPTRPYIGVQYWRNGVRLPDDEGRILTRDVMRPYLGPEWDPPDPAPAP